MIEVDCEYWKFNEKRKLTSGQCLLGLHGGYPSFGMCQKCEKKNKPVQGLGDLIGLGIHSLGLQKLVKKDGVDCKPCDEKRENLNKITI